MMRVPSRSSRTVWGLGFAGFRDCEGGSRDSFRKVQSGIEYCK